MILLTGAAGFVGQALLKQLLLKHKVRCIVLYENELKMQHKNLQIVVGNITDKPFVERAVNGVSCVIHAAAIIDAKNKNIYAVNAEGTKNLVEAAQKVKKFIFISTENVQYHCKDHYTKSKQQAEEIVKTLKNYTILREPIIYGPGDQAYIGKLIQLLQKHKLVPIPGNGTYLVQPVYIEDLVYCIQRAIEKPITGTHTIAGKEALSYEEIVDILLEELQLKRTKIHIPLILLKLAAILLPILFLKPPLTYTQLCNLAISRQHNLEITKKIFNYKPLSFKEGVKKLKRTEGL
jgi:NADH dehydrogenase